MIMQPNYREVKGKHVVDINVILKPTLLLPQSHLS